MLNFLTLKLRMGDSDRWDPMLCVASQEEKFEEIPQACRRMDDFPSALPEVILEDDETDLTSMFPELHQVVEGDF